ncbi:MAG TPA: 16S rRNA (guanine(966)-N(2))-methyltransferase RsmD [Candidatus Binatia bacterium]|nr:16S rRNA (guanine(966)-N(2))-methyltransferase RsmD [Candidatus Binatia bacterium]
MKRPPGNLRIIGGEWRSRIVEFAAEPGVRATPDRVRQTLFDWLAPGIEGAHCLDLFAGSGALGLEALSRGAAHCTFVDTGGKQVHGIRKAIELLRAGRRASVLQRDARELLNTPGAAKYDVVFLDPPFESELLAEVLPLLPPWLKPVHEVYVERLSSRPLSLPPGWSLQREKEAGQVSYGLARFAESA